MTGGFRLETALDFFAAVPCLRPPARRVRARGEFRAAAGTNEKV